MSRFFKKTTYNNETLNQLWMSILSDSHDICCNCNLPFAHLLDSIFPEGHKDRQLTVEEIINRDYSACLSGGTEEENHGLAGTGDAEEHAGLGAAAEEEEYIRDDELTTLIAAADDAATR